MNSVCFFHVATIGNYQSIVDRVFELLTKSELLHTLHRLYINVAGNEEVKLPENNKIKVLPSRSPLNEYEFSTLNYVKEYSNVKNANILYLHTKGAGTPSNICIDEWREYMLYFNIINFNNALEQLKNYDATGVDLSNEPTKHYSGNIWWSKTDHIKQLKYPIELPIILSERHKCEFWICSRESGKYNTLHQSNIDVYSRHLTRYPKELYEKSCN